MRSTLTAFTSLLALLLLIGCSLDNARTDDTAPPPPEAWTCDDDNDCESYGRNCQHGLCVDGPKHAQVSVSAAIFPPPDRSSMSPLTFNHEDLSLDEPTTITLPRVRSINGEVSQPGKSQVGRVQIFFSRQGDISGRRFTANATTDEQGNFSTQLPDGEYTVTLRTASESFPEFTTRLNVREDKEGSMVYFDLPAEDTYVRWTGRLVRLDDANDTHAVPDVTLWAQDTQSSSRSSMAVSGENGEFTFYMSKDVQNFQIQLRARNVKHGEHTYAIPASSFPTFEAAYDEDGTTQEIPGYELNIGRILPSKEISGTVYDHHGNTVAGARVLARARVSTGEHGDESSGGSDGPQRSTIEHSEATDADGRFTFRFPPYENIALTAFDNQQGPQVSDAHHTLDLSAEDEDAGRDLSLTLKPSLPLTFDVRDTMDQPVQYFEAAFELQDSEELSARNYDAHSEEIGGVFSIRKEMLGEVKVPAGSWRITIAPRVDLTLPRSWSYLRLNEGNTTVEATIPPGVGAGFIIEDEQGESVRGATVELWLESKDGDAPRLLGTAQSDAEGRATVLLPFIEEIQSRMLR